MSHGQVSMMAVGATDPVAKLKRVVWRPVTATTVIKVGQPVCYNSDLAADYKERTTNPVSSDDGGVTYAEGVQAYTARLFCVEEPLYANFEAFAGIVAKLGAKAGADGDFIEIFEPNGAVVPVWTDVNCTVNQSLLGIRDGQANVTIGEYGCLIGVAKETVDRSGTAGLCWAKIDKNMFQRQGEYSYRYTIEDEAGGDVIVNQTYVTSNQTAGQLLLERIDGKLDGAGHMNGGMVMIRAALNASASNSCQVVNAGMSYQASAVLSGEYNSVFTAGIGSSGTPNLSGGSIAAYRADYLVGDESGGAPGIVVVLCVHAGTNNFDGLLRIFNEGDCGDSAMTGDHAFDTADKCIPVIYGSSTGPKTTYYIPLMNNKGD